jgi:hypothetical protein
MKAATKTTTMTTSTMTTSTMTTSTMKKPLYHFQMVHPPKYV